MLTAYLGLGSDLGRRPAQLAGGIGCLAQLGLRVARCSSLYLTEPHGNPALPWFVNAVVEIFDPPPPAQLLLDCLEAEQRCGRLRHAQGREPETASAPLARTLDIDVLLYDDLVLNTAELSIPHPELHLRRFVLQPLAELAPQALHPSRQETVAELLARAPSHLGVWLLAPPLELAGR